MQKRRSGRRQAVAGAWGPEHLFALRQAVAAWDFCRTQMSECDEQLRKTLQGFSAKADWSKPIQPKKRGRKPNEIGFDVRPPLAQMAGVDLLEVEWIDATVALVIVAEAGLDISKFANEKHFGSWLGLAPRGRSSGKKRKDQRACGSVRLAWALRMAASTIRAPKPRSAVSSAGFQARGGYRKAVVATAYKLAGIVYRMLKCGSAYVKTRLTEYEKKFREKQLQAFQRRALMLGMKVFPG